MSDPAAELRIAAAALATHRAGGSHLTEDEIAAYHAGTLPPDREARAQDHLLACRECTKLLLGLEELTGEGEPVPPMELAAAWRRMQARLPSPERPFPLPSPRRTAPPVWLGVLAASLLVAVVGLSVWVASLRRSVDELAQPQVDTPVVDLFPSPLRGDREELPVVRLAPDARVFLLVLNPTDARAFPHYELAIARAGGTVVWQGEPRRNEAGSFNLLLPRALVGDGSYRLHLWGAGRKGRELMGEYGLRIVTPSQGR